MWALKQRHHKGPRHGALGPDQYACAGENRLCTPLYQPAFRSFFSSKCFLTWTSRQPHGSPRTTGPRDRRDCTAPACTCQWLGHHCLPGQPAPALTRLPRRARLPATSPVHHSEAMRTSGKSLPMTVLRDVQATTPSPSAFSG